MELKITLKKEESLLSRTRLEAEATFQNSTPPKDEFKKEFAKALGKDEKLIVIQGIYTTYGLKKAKVAAYLYENEEIIKKIEAKKESKGKAKKGGKEEKAKEAKP
jgi:ribosomal protein S24E